jgi:hypothetical protein
MGTRGTVGFWQDNQHITLELLYFLTTSNTAARVRKQRQYSKEITTARTHGPIQPLLDSTAFSHLGLFPFADRYPLNVVVRLEYIVELHIGRTERIKQLLLRGGGD